MSRTLSITWKIIGDLMKVSRLEFLIYIFLVVPAGLAPSVVVKMVENFSIDPVYIAVLGLFIFLDSLIYPITSLVSGNMMDRYTAFIVNRLMDKVNDIRMLSVFENQDVYRSLESVRKWGDVIPSEFLNLSYSIIRNTLTLVGILFVLFGIHPAIPILILTGLIPYAMVRRKFYESTWGVLYSSAIENHYMGHLIFTLFDSSRMHEIIAYRGADTFSTNYFRAFEKYFGRMRSIRKKYSLMGAITLLFSAGAIVFSMLLSGSVGVVESAILSFIYLQSAIVELVNAISNYSIYVVRPYSELLKFQNLKSPEQGNVRSVAGTSPYSVCFEDVRFSYPDGKEVLKGVSFRIRDGERVAIVGDNGAGKTTLMKLILRLYDPTSGSVRIFGVPVQEWDVDALRRIISVSFQDFGKFNFPLRDNITFAFSRYEDDDERLKRALEMGKVDFLSPDAMIGKTYGGVALSAGQWQRIAVARGFFRMDEETRIVLIDEPTENLDPISEYEIFRTIMEYSEGKTLILITHRLWSVKDADRILVMQDGRVVEEGNHDELLKLNGHYARMWRKQLEKYGLS